MKKRKGFIVYDFNGELVSVPIDPDKRAVPGGYWEAEDGSKLFTDSKPTPENTALWWEAQDGLDELASQKGRLDGARKAAAKRVEKAGAINGWLYPLLTKADSALKKEGKNQRGAKSLHKYLSEPKKNAKDFRLNPTDPRRKKISITRIKDWIKTGRPDTA